MIEAKATVGHGHFGDWIRDHLPFTPEWGQAFMRLARAKAKLPSHLTITDALALVAKPKERLPRWLQTPSPRHDHLVFSTADRARYHDLLRQLRAASRPEMVVLKALEAMAAHRDQLAAARAKRRRR